MFSSAFSSSIQALSAYSQSFAAISDNVVNISTPGYKDTQIQFKDLVANSSKGSVYDNLGGSRPVVRSYAQNEGSTIFTARDLDAALSGQGFFLSNTEVSGSGDYLLTAAGHFDLQIPPSSTTDETYIVDMGGNYLMGWPYNPTTGDFTTGTGLASLSPIRTDSQSSTYGAVATDSVSMRANLNSDSLIGESKTFSIEILDGTGNSDGINDAQEVNFIMTRTASDTWDLNVTGTNGTVTAPATTSVLTFDASGLTPSINGGGTDLSVAIDWASTGSSSNVTFDFERLSQFSGKHILNDFEINGTLEGIIETVAFGENGIVLGSFSNGQIRPVAKIPAADVMSPENLERVGETHFKATAGSGAIDLYQIDLTERVQFISHAYEASSTDLSQEMTDMIIMQRAYSSAATSLKTIDEMFKTATDIK